MNTILSNTSESPFFELSTITGAQSIITKRAKLASEVISWRERAIDSLTSRALFFVTGGVRDVEPDCQQLLLKQYDWLLEKKDVDSVVNVLDLYTAQEPFSYTMEYLPGDTAQQLLDKGQFTLDAFIELTSAVEKLSGQGRQGYHGDLKPTNIICTKDGIKLIDPGYFGPIKTRLGEIDMCMVTTPAYYPYLEPDDMLALGFILWQTVLNYHPLAVNAASDNADAIAIEDELFERLRSHQMVGQHFLSPLFKLKLPTQLNPALSDKFEEILLKSLKLRIRNGKLATATGYNTPAELIDALKALKRAG